MLHLPFQTAKQTKGSCKSCQYGLYTDHPILPDYLFCENIAGFVKEMACSLPYSCETACRLGAREQKARFLIWAYVFFHGTSIFLFCWGVLSRGNSFCLREKYILMPVLFNLISSHLLSDVEKLKTSFQNSTLHILPFLNVFSVVLLEKEAEMFQNLFFLALYSQIELF